jgi:hypothetical protein
MRRALFLILAAVLLAPAAAFAQQTVNFTIGGFVPTSEDARDRDDVLVQDLSDATPLAFQVSDFKGWTFSGEWLFALTHNLEGGLGLGYYQRSVPSVYATLVNADGSEIEQELKLRIVPFTATIRFLPLGYHNGFEPYIGGGVAAYWWRYSESGQFVDPADNSIFRNSYVGSGGAVGPTILGGARVSLGPTVVGGEIRWQGGHGDLPADQFLGSRIDLGGMNYLFTIGVRF